MRGLLLAAVVLLGALPAQAQEVNRTDPAAVAKAYLEACEKWDAAAAGQVVLDDGEAQSLRELAQGPTEAVVRQGLGEVLCLPLTRHTRYAVGEVATTGEEARVQVVATYCVPLTLVLKRGDDGQWRVAVRESILTTTGAQDPMLLGNAPPVAQQLDESTRPTCLSNLKQLMLAMLQYAQDHDEVLPPAETWRDDLMPYCHNVLIFQCPVNPWGYTYNATLAKKPLGQIAAPAETIVLFEVGHVEPNMAADPAKVKWVRPHDGGACVGYADGHVKWLAGQ
jgi:prepilin-type processing-associated H-X9-DG protein